MKTLLLTLASLAMADQLYDVVADGNLDELLASF